MWDPNAPIDDVLLAAAQGQSIEYVQEQRKQQEEHEATQRFIEELAKKDVESCEDVKKAAAKKNLAPTEVLKRKHEEFEKGKADETQKFLDYLDRRKKNEKIIDFTATLHDKGKRISAKVTREGISFPRIIEKLERKTFGLGEWVEIFHLINKRKSASSLAVLKIIENLFESVKGMEKKLGIQNSTLDRMLCSAPPAKRPRLAGSFSHQFTSEIPHFFQPHFSTLTHFDADDQLNTDPPAGIPFEEGKVIDKPAGIFYATFHGRERFFRLSEVSIASTKFLMAIRKRCVVTSNAHSFIHAIDSELTKPERLNDPDYQLIKAESTWD